MTEVREGPAEPAGPFSRARRSGRALPLRLAGLAIAALLGAAGCAGSGQAQAVRPEPRAHLPSSAADPTGAYRLLIEIMEDETASLEMKTNYMRDIRDDLARSLEASGLLESVTTDPSSDYDLVLLPVLLHRRVAQQDPTPVVEITLRFELRGRGASGMIWSREYSETTPQGLDIPPVSGDRGVLLATRAAQLRIYDALRVDLAKLFLGY